MRLESPSTSKSRSRRRQALKKVAGKKSTVFEETYLLHSLTKLLTTRLTELQTETSHLLPQLLLLSSNASSTNSPHQSAAINLQKSLAEFELFGRESLDRVWGWREVEWKEEKSVEDGLKERGEYVQPAPEEKEEGRERVERPTMAKEKWKIGLLDVL